MIKQALFVGLGGAAGSILRYVTHVVTTRYYAASFPLATFMVNVAGCFLVGLIFGMTAHETTETQNLKFLLITGFCGGFTTFSAFALENVKLMHSGDTTLAVLYTFGSIAAGLLAAWIGLLIAR